MRTRRTRRTRNYRTQSDGSGEMTVSNATPTVQSQYLIWLLEEKLITLCHIAKKNKNPRTTATTEKSAIPDANACLLSTKFAARYARASPE